LANDDVVATAGSCHFSLNNFFENYHKNFGVFKAS